MNSPNPFRDLDRRMVKRAELAAKAEARRQAEAEKEARRQAAIDAQLEAEQAKRKEAQDLTDAIAEEDAAIAELKRQIEADRLAKLKAEASTPEKVAAFWAQAHADHEALSAVQNGTVYQKMPQHASIALRTVTGFDVDPDLWQVEAGGNIALLHDFAGLTFRCLRVANTMREALNVRDVFVIQVATPFNSWASVVCPGSVAALLPQYPSMRRAEKVEPAAAHDSIEPATSDDSIEPAASHDSIEPAVADDSIDAYFARSAVQRRRWR